MHKTKTLTGIIALLLISAMVAFVIITFKSNSQKDTSDYRVLSSIYIINQITELLTDNIILSDLLIPENVDPHDYNPTPADIIKIKNADLLIINGVVDSWIYDYVDNENIILDLSKAPGISDSINKNDPHYWQDFRLIKQMEKAIFKSLYDSLPAYHSELTKNLDTAIDKIDYYLLLFESTINNCPNMHTLTFHEAYNYFNSEFDIKSFSLLGISTESDITAEKIIELEDYILSNNIKHLLLDPLEQSLIAQNLANKHNLIIVDFYTLEGSNKNKTIFELLDSNLINLKQVLECKTK